MSLKRPMVVYEDISLYATFVRWVEKSTEKNYVFLEYVRLNEFPPKKRILEKAIHKDCIHTVHSSSTIPGVEPEVIKIFTNEPGSVVANVFKSDSERIIAELREKNRKLKMQVASSKQNEEDARSGVNKAISSMKSVTRQSNPPAGFEMGYPSPGYPPQGNVNDQYDGFEDF